MPKPRGDLAPTAPGPSDPGKPSPTEQRRDIARALARLGRGRPPVPPYWRPTTRADCQSFPRPCPYVGCRYNLVLDITHTGGIVYRAPADWTQRPGSNCALDYAAQQAHTCLAVGKLMGTHKERIRQEEAVALAKLVDCGIERPEAFGRVPQVVYDHGPDYQ